MQQVAIIGSGIAGLGAAHFLQRNFDLTVFEAGDHVGGHTNTIVVKEEDRDVPIDTGFMVFNHVTYPNLLRLFRQLDVPTKRTNMSFSVRHGPRRLEFCGSSLNHLFAQRRNLLRPGFYRLLMRIERFNREAADALDDAAFQMMTLAEYVAHRGYGQDFLHHYIIPMSSAVWSTPPAKMLEFPATTLLRFFHNHGFLGLHTQHPWWTVQGGARTYVEKLTAPIRDRIHVGHPVRRVRRGPGGVEVTTDHGMRRFDKVILACHPPQTLRILGDDATSHERRILGAFRFQPNVATLHTDESVMPRRRLAWSAWNYRIDAAPLPAEHPESRGGDRLQPSTHYWMNRLQGVSDRANYFVSINGQDLVDSRRVLQTIEYEHPLFDLEARKSQGEMQELNGAARGGSETYYAGAWQRYGFHEDGLLSAVQVAELLLGGDPWGKAP